jgi:hypothetical protein
MMMMIVIVAIFNTNLDDMCIDAYIDSLFPNSSSYVYDESN